jgi:hypothetical protein
LAGSRLAGAPPAPAGAGAGIGRVLLDDADQQIEQKLALLRGQRIKNARVGGCILAAKPVKHPIALWREPQNPGAPVGTVHAPLDKTPFTKLLDQQADMGSFDAEPGGKAVLIYSGLAVFLVETSQDCKL